MKKENTISVFCFGEEIGKLSMDENQHKSYFQYNPDYLQSNRYTELFPNTGIIKRTPSVQVFSQFNNETFRGIPPMFADSLPDLFGNIIFKKWLEAGMNKLTQISVLEQLSYVSNRGMGALEYFPAKETESISSVRLNEIVTLVEQILHQKEQTLLEQFNHEALVTLFKIGSSAGGVRPKVLISENLKTGQIIPGDISFSSEYTHYLVKLGLQEEIPFQREVIEYCYYQTLIQLGIQMMPSKLIEEKHFATQRFDRQNGEKKHILTASGLTGWDFKQPEMSSYESLFELAIFLNLPSNQLDELFRRMVFNVVFCNTDDHLKNHSFIYDPLLNKWNLAPAYDITYSLNPLVNYTRVSRALSINGKRMDINLKDILTLADTFTIKNQKQHILEIQSGVTFCIQAMEEQGIPKQIIERIQNDFVLLIS